MMDSGQALRGASSSIGVITSFQVKTFPVPASATVFNYNWDLNPADAVCATEQFQNFVMTDIPQEFAAEIVLSKGSCKGRIKFGLTGGWYAPADQFEAVIAPFLNTLPKPSGKTITPGTYIESVQNLGGLDRLNTTDIPDTHDTFYAKSIMTPEKTPMTVKALNAFMSYLADPGYTADTVRLSERFHIDASASFLCLCKIQDWFVELELYGGTNSAINNVAPDATAFANRNSMFTIQFYTSSNDSAFPDSGIALLNGMSLLALYAPHVSSHLLRNGVQYRR